MRRVRRALVEPQTILDAIISCFYCVHNTSVRKNAAVGVEKKGERSFPEEMKNESRDREERVKNEGEKKKLLVLRHF